MRINTCFRCFTFLRMENTASTTFFFTYFVALHQTKENETGIVTLAMFCQKISLKNPYFAAILNFPTVPEVVIKNKVTYVLGDIKPDKMIP